MATRVRRDAPAGLTPVARDSGIVTLLNAIALASGLALFAWVAAVFGATEATDAFFLALTIPMLFIGPVLASVSATLVPALTECRIRRPDRVGAIVGSALVWSVTGAAAAALLTGLLTPWGLAAAGRVLSPTVQHLVLVNVIALLPLVVAQTAATVLAMASNAAGCFWLPPCALIVRQVVTGAAVAALHARLGMLALPVAFSVGAVAQLLVLVALWDHAATPIRPGWQLSDELRRSLRLTVPLLLGTAFLHVAIVVTRLLAAQLPAGSVTALDYATRIYAAVIEVVGSGVLLVTLTDWSAVYARGEIAKLQLRVRRTVTLTLFALVPVVVVLYAVREPLVGLWLGHTGIDPALRHATAMTLGYLALGLPLEMIGRIYSQLLVVRRAPWSLAAIAAVRVSVTVALAATLSRSVGVPGLGLAETLGLAVAAVALSVAARRLGGHSLTETLVAASRLAMAGLGAWLAANGARAVLSGQANVILLVTVSTTALVAYLALAWVFQAPELRTLIGYAVGRRAVAR
jgi:putative peptidoglycan lipid II flippase